MVLMPIASAGTSHWSGPSAVGSSNPGEGIDQIMEGWNWASNQSVEGATLLLNPLYQAAENNGTHWSASSGQIFENGTLQSTQSHSIANALTLDNSNSNVQFTNFTNASDTFIEFTSGGSDSGLWNPVNLSAVADDNLPSSAISGHFVAGTVGLMSHGSGTHSYLQTPFWDISPSAQSISLEFHSWLDIGELDAAWIEYSTNKGLSWHWLNLSSYSTSHHSYMFEVWSGNASNWTFHQQNLTNSTLFDHAETLGFRFQLSTQTSARGWFLDDISLKQNSDAIGSWFHGNLNGQYARNADGQLLLQHDLSGYDENMQIQFMVDWDIHGQFSDNLRVQLSLDAGQTYTPLTTHPGIPGLGQAISGKLYHEESFGWKKFRFDIPQGTSNHVNASSAQFMFQVITDGSLHFGGSSADGWEGIRIDDIAIITDVGGASVQQYLVDDFSSNASVQLNQPNGSNGEWQHITYFDAYSSTTESEDFEMVQMLPQGWSIIRESGDSNWEVGAVSSLGSVGPISWQNGTQGVGIDLHQQYQAHTYTHLISPLFHVKEFGFNTLFMHHWICTEAAWDGGSIFVSSDDGYSWHHFGSHESGFYDQTSLVNAFSPFYGLEIFDGSSDPTNCSSPSKPFSYSHAHLDQYAGKDIKIRYSFFSDTFAVDDGWYIDATGVETQSFVSDGSWTSELIERDESGWGVLDGVVKTPPETGYGVDVLYPNGTVIPNHQNLTFPIVIEVPKHETNNIQIQVHLWSNNIALTPQIERIHLGANIYMTPSDLNTENQSIHRFENHGTENIEFHRNMNHWRVFNQLKPYCIGEGIQISALREEMQSVPSFQPVEATYIDLGNCTLSNSVAFQPQQVLDIRITIQPGGWFEYIQVETSTLRAPRDLSLQFGNSTTPDWLWNSTFGEKFQFDSVEVDGEPIVDVENSSFWQVNERIKFSIYLPSIAPPVDSNHQLVHHYSSNISLLIDGQKYDYSIDQATEHSENVTSDLGTMYFNRYEWFLEFNSSSSVSILHFNIQWKNSLKISIDPHFIEENRFDFEDQSSLNLTFTSMIGGLTFDGELHYESPITDTWASLPETTLLPEQKITVSTQHEIHPGEPPISSVSLFASSQSNGANPLFEMSYFHSNPEDSFIQESGFEIISLLSEQSLAELDGFKLNLDWELMIHWEFDDVETLHWFVAAKNTDGLQIGPIRASIGTSFNKAVENDVEIVNLTTVYLGQNLDDRFLQYWPLPVSSNSSLTLTGQLQFTDIPNSFNLSEKIELSIEIVDYETALRYEIRDAQVVDEGYFTVVITTPEDIPSSTRLVIQPKIHQLGSKSDADHLDDTSELTKIHIIHDQINPVVNGVFAAAPGGYHPADGHVWYADRDIALQVELQEDLLLPESIQMHYDGGSGYSMMPVFVPPNSLNPFIDVPLVSASEIAKDGDGRGTLRIYFTGTDHSGRPLTNGGSQDNPLVEMYIQPQYDTIVPVGSLNLDTIENRLFPGKSHHFSFDVLDENGIQSFDQIRFDITGKSDGDTCQLGVMIWNNSLEWDALCYLKEPVFTYEKYELMEKWKVNIFFVMDWNFAQGLENETYLPSLSIIDENVPVGLGFDAISTVPWQMHEGLKFILTEVKDHNSPYASLYEGTIFCSTLDKLDFFWHVEYGESGIIAENLPTFTVSFQVNEAIFPLIFSSPSNQNGTGMTSVDLSKGTFTTPIASISMESDLIYTHHYENALFDIKFDITSPQLHINTTEDFTFSSDEMNQWNISFSISDVEGMLPNPVYLNWMFVRNGMMIEETNYQIPLEPVVCTALKCEYSGVIDLERQFIFEQGDAVAIWINATDASGRPIKGVGSSQASPILSTIEWVEYQIIVTDIILEPSTPQVGMNANLLFTTKNTGRENGTSQFTLIDGFGNTIESQSVNFASNETKIIPFRFEIWKEGEINLFLVIDNEDPKPVILPDAIIVDQASASFSSKVVGLSTLFLLSACFVLYLVLQNNKPKSEHDADDYSWFEEE